MFIGVYLLDVYFFLCTAFDTTYNTHNVMSKRTSKIDKFEFWQKLIIILVFRFFNDMTQWGLILFVSCISFLSFVIYSKELPDYNPILLTCKIISRGIFLWSGICLILIKIIQSVIEFESGIILFFIGIPFIFSIAYKWKKGNLKKLLIHHSKFVKPFEFLNRIFIINNLIDNFDSRYAQFTLRGYVNKMEEFCTLENCVLKKYMKCMNKKEEAIGYLLLYIEMVFQVGISKNPTNITLRICYINFLINKLNKIHKAYLELNFCEKLEKGLEEDFIIYRHKKQFGENGDFNFSEEIDESGINVLFQNNFQKFKNLIIKVSFLYIDFWSLLYENQMEEQEDMTVLNDYGNQINNGVEEIHKLFHKLQEIKENEPELLELYSDFLKEIRADYEQSNELKMILEKVHKRLKHDDLDELNWINSFNIDIYALNHSDKNLYLVFDTKLSNFGTILNVSLGLCSILGYPKEELKGKNIKILIPDIFHTSHNRLLTKLMEEYQKGHRAKKRIDFRNSDTFALSKSKYLVPFNFKACVISTDSEYFWLLKVNKESSYYTNFNSVELNNSNYNTYTIITNRQFIIKCFTSNCVKFFGLKASDIVGVSDISHYIKEFHEEFLKYIIENEEQTPEDKLRIKQNIVKLNYKNPTQITWLKKEHSEFFHSNADFISDKRKDAKILYLTCTEIIIDDSLDGFNFKFETSPMQNYFSSVESQSQASKVSKYKAMSHENSISKKSSRIQINQNVNKRKSMMKYENRNYILSPMPSITSNTNIIERNYIPKIPKVGGFKFNPNILSYQINANEKITDRRKYLKDKAMVKIKEMQISSSNKTESSGEEFSEFTDSSFDSVNSETSNINEKKRKELKNSTVKANNEEYYKVNFSKIRFKIYDYKSKGFIEKNFEKKSKVEMVIENSNKGDFDDDEKNGESSGIQQIQTKEENEKELQQKREMLLQQIQKSLLQEDTQTSITTLRLISIILFSFIIGYGFIFLFVLINDFHLYEDKYIYIRYSFAIYRGILHAVSITRELVLVSFEEYDNFYSTREFYRETLINSLKSLYVRMSNYIEQLTKKTAQLSQENYQTVFGTILPTYIINSDFSVNVFNLTYISTISKAATSIFEITQLSEYDIMPLNKDIYFFITNTLNGILTDTRIAESTYTNQLHIIINDKKKSLLIIFIIISIIDILTYFVINKAFMDVDARKNSYLEVFFEIKGNLIISSLTKCENFVKRLQNTDNDDLISILEDDENDEGDNTFYNIKGHSSDGDGNRITSGNIIFLNSIIISMFLFIIIYFLVIVLLFYNFSKNLKYLIIVYNHESRLEMEHFLVYTYIREYIFDSNTIVNNTYISEIIDSIVTNYTIEQMNNEKFLTKYHHLYGNNYTNLRYHIYQNDICSYTQSFFDTFVNDVQTDCYDFLDEGVKYGLNIIHSNFFEELRLIKAQRESYGLVWSKYNFIYNLTTYKTENYSIFRNNLNNEILKEIYDYYSPLAILSNEKMKKLTIVFEYFLSPIYIELFESLNEVIKEFQKKNKIIILGMCIAYISLFTLLYLIIWRRYVESLNTIIYQTKRMLAIIPKGILASLKSIGKLLDIKTQSAQKISSDHKPLRISTKTGRKSFVEEKPLLNDPNINTNNNNEPTNINDNINTPNVNNEDINKKGPSTKKTTQELLINNFNDK